MDGLGDHGWEVSHGSQIELFAVVGTVVLGGADNVGCGGATDIAGLWNVGNVTVELGRDGRELETGSRGVVEGGLAGAAPVGWHTGDGVHGGGSCSVPGSEGGESGGWHPEEWELGGQGEGWCQLLVPGAGRGGWEALLALRPCAGGVFHIVDLPVATDETESSGERGVLQGESGGHQGRIDHPGALVVNAEAR